MRSALIPLWPLLALFPFLSGCQSQRSVSPLIALFTDFGPSDPYVAQLKGSIKTVSPTVEILDLSHANAAYDIPAASYLLAKSTRTLPAGTVVIAVVDPTVGSSRAGLAVRTQAGRFYLAPDNGILTEVLAREGLAEARILPIPTKGVSSTFHARDIFGPAAAQLANEDSLALLGTKAEKILRLPRNTATVMPTMAKGQVLFIDHYGNILTNIPGSELGKLKVGQLLTVRVRGKSLSLPFLRTYAEAPASRPFALINSDGEFEIAVNQGSAARKLGIKAGDPVILKL